MNPYEALPDEAFWKLAVAQKNMFSVDKLWAPKFDIRRDSKVVTFGSCFAQHIGAALKDSGFSWLCTEPAPDGLSPANTKRFNYGLFSCRTGNIYTTSLLRQWVEWALELRTCPDEVWQVGERYYDPFRPRVEPQGFSSITEMRHSRAQTLESFRAAIRNADFFVFTMGLTESWLNSRHGYEYPMCPGTTAGEFRDDIHTFKNQDFEDVRSNLAAAIDLMRKENKHLKFLLTVSPVPLTATNSGNHVLVATMESKSCLRAVAGQLTKNRVNVDYFPSYEIINSPVFRGTFFEPNGRSINPFGVRFVMDTFFNSLERRRGPATMTKRENEIGHLSKEDSVCEEELLDAFGPGPAQ